MSRVAAELKRVASFALIRASGLFDPDWYRAQAAPGSGRRRLPGHALPLAHYVWRGRRAGASPHPLMEPSWFAPGNWRTDAADPFARLLLKGRTRRRAPHPLFDPEGWVRAHPEAATHRWGPFGHFCATAADATVLPAVPPFEGSAVTLGAARAELAVRLAALHRQEALRVSVRPSASYDVALAEATVARHAGFAADGAKPLVTVVMPVRDRAAVVGAAVASVLAQTFSGWELVVVDDGSKDGTPDAVRAAAAGDPRVRLVEGAARGVSAARNAGAAVARGRYLAWLDSDNAWEPAFLATVLGALAERGLAAGFAIAAVADGGATRYRRLDLGPSRERAVEQLAVSNAVDLNVLVAERAAVEAAGGFDETLRRTVDYDLVWSLVAAGTVPRLVPFVGVAYEHSREAADRITVRESPAWREVVKRKHLVPPAAGAGRVPGRLSVLVGATAARPAWDTAAAAAFAAAQDGADVEVVVADDALPRAGSLLLACLPLLDPAVRVLRSARSGGPPLAADLALAASTGEFVAFAGEGVEPWPGWSGPVLAALAEPGAVAAQPLLVAPDGRVAAAGAARSGDRLAPLLAGLRPEDARRAGEVLRVPAAGGRLLVAPAAAVGAGLDPLAGDDAWAELSARLAAGTAGVAVPTAALAGSPPVLPSSPAPDGVGEAAGVWAAAGFAPRPDGPPGPLPFGGLRWSIRMSAPVGPASRRWGDLHFARALAAALERLGQRVGVDHRPALHDDSLGDDVVLTLRGLFPATPPPGAVSLLWVISHPDLVTPGEAAGYDRVFGAGPVWAARFAASSGIPVEPLLQATDPTLFHPGPAEAGGEPVLFVGNSRRVYRPVVRDLVEAGVEVGVHGNDWEGFLGPGRVRSRLVANEDLPRHYRSAGIVLNDHWDDMRAEGFYSNRLFDAAACGARVVSDHVDGVEELFGGLVRTYRSAAELVAIVREGAAGFPDDAARAALGARIGAEHSFDHRARTLLDAALAVRGSG